MDSSSFFRPLLAPLIAVLVFAGCAPSVSAPQAAPKQELVLVQGADVDSLDPQATTTSPSRNVFLTFSEALTKISYTELGEPKVEPGLATSWKQLNDTTWQFKLREGVKFSNGEVFDAAAVKFSFDRLIATTASPASKYAASVSRMEIVDGSTINFITKTPYPLVLLDFTQMYLIPPKYTASLDKQAFALKPIGTGPFKLVEWVADDHITVEANPDYWAGRPKLDKITFKPIPELATRSAALQTGQADIVTGLGVADVATLRQKPGIRVEVLQSARIMYVTLDQNADPIMKNLKVRQALNYAADKEAIVNSIFKGEAKVLQGQGLTPSYFGFNPALKPYPYDPALAKRLLAEAGYPNGFEMNLWTTRGVSSGDYESMQALAGQLAQVGVKVNVRPLENAVYNADSAAKKLTPALIKATATHGDASTMFEHFRGGSVRSYAKVPEFDALLQQERSTLDPEKRLRILQQAAEIENTQALAIWLNSLPSINGLRSNVDGFRMNPQESYDLYKVSLK